MKAFIVHASNLTIDDQTQVQLFGRLENGQSFVSLNKFTPYFFIETSDLKSLSSLLKKFKISETNLSTFSNKRVTKIFSSSQTELNKLSSAIHKLSISTYEADIKPHMRFIIDNNLLGSINLEGDYESSEKLDRIYQNPEITPSDYIPKLKIASIDIETDMNLNSLFCIGIYSENYKKNFMVTNKKLTNVASCNSEADCLEKFKSALISLDPDIITGWNVIDFDLKYLQSLFAKNKIPFDLGRSNNSVKIRIESGFFRSSKVEIPGRQVLDGLNLIRDPFIKEAPSIKNAKFESYSLEDVAQKILGKGKILKGKSRHDEISLLYKKNQQKLADYNIQDCKLAYEILEKTKTLDLAIERSQLTGLPLDKLSASIASFDSLYIRLARSHNLVSPSTHYNKKEERITGGYVKEAIPGIYHNVLVLDFKSLYPSIIKTFNIDPSSFSNKKIPNSIESPNKAYFKNTSGLLPEIISKLHEAREKAKKEKRELASYAIKIIMNSFFGVLASPNCRYFSLKMANAITHFGQHIIKLTAKEIESLGYKTLYSDTDSVFISSNLPKTKANTLGLEIQEKINSFYKNYTKKEYKRESFLELEFEKQYLSLIIPKVRGSETAAKKRYAGLIEINGKEKLEIVGLEAIRGDWTQAAQDFQRELLIKAFKKEPIESFILNYIKKVQSGSLDKKLIYKKSIRKSLDKYTKTTPPHVKAARKLPKLESNIIQYYITTDGPEPLQQLKHKLDYEHYIKKQIAPIAQQILSLLDKNFDDLISGSKQSKLF
jgi:DNA polymerase II